MRLNLTALLVWSAIVFAAVGCGRKDGPRPPILDGENPEQIVGPQSAVFTSSFRNPPSDSGYFFTYVDDTGDAVSLYSRWILGDHPHIRMVGPISVSGNGPRTKLLGLHRIEIQNPGQSFSGAEDFCTMGGNGILEDISLERLYETPDSISWRQTWRFIKKIDPICDTLDIVRRIRLRQGEPYFLVRYEFTWVDDEPESLRYIWHLQRQNQLRASRSLHEVGFAPGYGPVTTRHVFDAADLDFTACMMRTGNPLATRVDTLEDGLPSFMSETLKRDLGSGVPAFAAGFIRFNPDHEIFPEEIAWIDTAGHYIPSLDFDSPSIVVDSTNVLDGDGRFLLARSRVLVFSKGLTATMEYAVGRAVVDSGPRITTPDIVWSDGTISPGTDH